MDQYSCSSKSSLILLNVPEYRPMAVSILLLETEERGGIYEIGQLVFPKRSLEEVRGVWKLE